jgi:hypothetical protein
LFEQEVETMRIAELSLLVKGLYGVGWRNSDVDFAKIWECGLDGRMV